MTIRELDTNIVSLDAFVGSLEEALVLCGAWAISLPSMDASVGGTLNWAKALRYLLRNKQASKLTSVSSCISTSTSPRKICE